MTSPHPRCSSGLLIAVKLAEIRSGRASDLVKTFAHLSVQKGHSKSGHSRCPAIGADIHVQPLPTVGSFTQIECFTIRGTFCLPPRLGSFLS